MCFSLFRWEEKNRKFKKIIKKDEIEKNIQGFDRRMNIIFYHKGTIPLAYIIPKNKDLKKY